MGSNTKSHVFVTGATGFIGSAVVRVLCRDGKGIRVLVRDAARARQHFSKIDGVDLERLDFLEGDLFAGPPAERKNLFLSGVRDTDVVIHLAEAKSSVKDSEVKNVKSFGLLLEAAGETKSVSRFVLVSAFMAGGIPTPLPQVLEEDMTGDEFPDPYYRWKRMAERLLVRASSGSHYSYAIVRPALVYGPRAEWLVPMLKAIHRFGRFWIPLPNGGRAMLGTVHVEDAANLIAKAGWSLAARNCIVHAVDNGGTSYVDWMSAIASAAGWKVRIASFPAGWTRAVARGADALGGVVGLHYGASLWAEVLSTGCGYSNERMRKVTGELLYPTIREGVPGMIRWFNNSRL
ncbi:MAG TPA: NAD-dependent epimerase/dehydratase family protein [Bacteroidota bacterium]|nr:NAD-dependent epimerase/dehydratase family protein [Bacteroidota bacterium]